jgi:ABC-type xylose transport system permease subunit
VDRRVVLLAVLVAHLAVATSHGVSHGLIPVNQPAWQNALVLLTTFLGPTVGGLLAWRDHPLGVPLFTVSIAGALLVGGLLHFVLESPDHVHAVPQHPWRLPFRVSAGALLVTDALGTVVGLRFWEARTG